MKKSLIAILLTFFLTLMTASALAGGPVGGLKTVRLPENGIALAGLYDSPVQVEYPELVTGKAVQIKVTGAKEGYSFALTVGVDWTTVYQYVYDMGTNPVCNYTFYEPGEYLLFVFDEKGKVEQIEIMDVTGTNYVQAKVDSIVRQCPDGDDFTRALWLHDYLATHTYYDSTLAYHGADVLLMKGYGVCQSYGEAYRKLLLTAGIPCDVVSADEMGHEWNAMKLNGKWYEVDVTWDTLGFYPAGQGHPESTCRYEYFAIPDEIMRYDHYGHTRSDCVSMDDNYFVRTGEAAEWMGHYISEIGGKLNGTQPFTITVDNENFSDPYAWSRQDLAAAGVAYELNDRTIIAGGTEYELTAEHRPSSRGVMSKIVQVTAEKLVRPHLTLPADTKEIGEQAFYGTACFYVEIPSGCETIGSKAFGGIETLTTVEIPETVKNIASDAFSGSTNVTLLVKPGSYAQRWANDNGIPCETY